MGLKVRTLFNSPGNEDFENVIIFNPRVDIGRGRAKIVITLTCMLTSNVN